MPQPTPTRSGPVRVTYFGPYEGDRNAPSNSIRYQMWRDGYYDSRGNPHRPGDIALTADQVQGARYGDTVTRGGVTGRFTDVTHPRMSGRVDVWAANGAPTNVPSAPRSPTMVDPDAFFRDLYSQLNTAPDTGSVARITPTNPDTAYVDGAMVSPDFGTDTWASQFGRTPMPEVGHGVPDLGAPDLSPTQYAATDANGTPLPSYLDIGPLPGRSPALTTDPNLDWTGSDLPTYAGPGGRSPGPFSDPNDDWSGADTPSVAFNPGRSPNPFADPNDDWTGTFPDIGNLDLDIPPADLYDPAAVIVPPHQVASSDGLPSSPGLDGEPLLYPNTEEWQTSAGDRRFLPTPTTDDSPPAPPADSVATTSGHPPSIFGDPNDDWTGAYLDDLASGPTASHSLRDFGSNLALPPFNPWNFAARDVLSGIGDGSVETPGSFTYTAPGEASGLLTNDWTWNSSRGTWERFESGNLLTDSGFIDPATGMNTPPSGDSGSYADNNSSGNRYGNSGSQPSWNWDNIQWTIEGPHGPGYLLNQILGNTPAHDPGQNGAYNGSPGGFAGLFGAPVGTPAPSNAQLASGGGNPYAAFAYARMI